ncbi:hypothetical protein HDU91_004727 [Kappamyces sp. JEL0680]|nr:hypothetical protein HDU91_004727 [Kappamyces sp. JEL0680]
MRCGVVEIESGIYGNPPRFYPWFKQLCLFLFSWFWVKAIIVLALLLFPFFTNIAAWLLSPLEQDERAQIVVVMFLFPLMMNIVQAWLTDRIIKGKRPVVHLIASDESLLSDSSDEAFHDALEELSISGTSRDDVGSPLLTPLSQSNVSASSAQAFVSASSHKHC